jgi:hypothetical protein
MLGALGYQVGWQEPVYVPNPAAGQPWSYTVDGRYYVRVLGIRFTFVTDAVVGNRFPQVSLMDTNGATIISARAGGTVVASSTLNVNLALNTSEVANGASGSTWGQLPDLLIPPGWSWSVTLGSLDAGDQFSNVVLLVQRFPNDATVISAGQ